MTLEQCESVCTDIRNGSGNYSINGMKFKLYDLRIVPMSELKTKEGQERIRLRKGKQAAKNVDCEILLVYTSKDSESFAFHNYSLYKDEITWI